MNDTLLHVRETVERHKRLTARVELREHDERIAEQLADMPARKPPYEQAFGCGCRIVVRRSSDEGGEWETRRYPCARRVSLMDES